MMVERLLQVILNGERGRFVMADGKLHKSRPLKVSGQHSQLSA